MNQNSNSRHSALLLSLALSITLFQPSSDGLAASSDWQDLGGGKARLVANKDPESGNIEGMIEVRLEKGWKTYWKSPGGSGIAPEFDFSRSRNISLDPVRFPVPVEISLPDSTFYGYKEHVSFPFSGLANNLDAEIRLDALFGVCEEICIPATASFEITSDALNRSDPRAQVELALAHEALPDAPSAAFEVKSARLSGSVLHLTGKSDNKSAPKAVISVEGVWVSDPVALKPSDGGGFTGELTVPGSVLEPFSKADEIEYTLLEQDMSDKRILRAVSGKILVNKNRF